MIAEVCPKLWLCSRQEANSPYFVDTIKPDVILNVDQLPDEAIRQPTLLVHHPLQDGYDPEQWPVIENMIEVMEGWRQQDRTIMVHCAAGCSRSPSLVIGYLFRHSQPHPFRVIYQAVDYLLTKYQSPLGPDAIRHSPVLRLIREKYNYYQQE